MQRSERIDDTNGENDWLAEQFEEQRSRLRAVAYRLLGSTNEADDAVQEAWLRLNGQPNQDAIVNVEAWLVTVAGRVALNMLRARKRRREVRLDDHLQDPSVDRVDRGDGVDPEYEALVTDAVGRALLVVLESLTPAERLAYVLHDMFAISFEEIAAILDRSPEATRQLASRARRSIGGRHTVTDADPAKQNEVVQAFLAASRRGDFAALIAALDPDVVVRDDMADGKTLELRGTEAVAGRTTAFRRLGLDVRPADQRRSRARPVIDQPASDKRAA